MVFANILFLHEIKVTSYGALTIGGVISLFLGAMMLFRSDSPLLPHGRDSLQVIRGKALKVKLLQPKKSCGSYDSIGRQERPEA